MAMDEELLSRQVPHSLEAEQSVLGAILIDSRCIMDVVGILKPTDFYMQQNRQIYEAIVSGDAALAEQLTARHIENAKEHMLRSVKYHG